MSQQHVCIVTTAHPMDDVRVYSKIAISFLDAGYKVSWVGPDMNFFANSSQLDSRINYVHTPVYRNRLRRFTARRRLRRAAEAVTDVDWYYSPDPDAAEVAVELAREHGAKSIFDIHEVFHGALLDRWLLGREFRFVRKYVQNRIAATCATADLVIGVSNSVLEPYLGSAKRIVIRNCAPSWFADNPVSDVCGEGRQVVSFMHGKALPTNGTMQMLTALSLLDPKEKVELVIFPGLKSAAAPYMPQLATELDSLGVRDRVLQLDSITHDQMPDVLAQRDVGVIAYGRGFGEDSLPNRIFEYMAAGLAVLVPSYAREMVRIVDGEAIGLTVDFEDPQAIAAAMSWLASNPSAAREMGSRARTAFTERHNWDAEFQILLEAMSSTERSSAHH